MVGRADSHVAVDRPSMKLRSRDFGDGHTLVSAGEQVGDPSMKLRSRDFGDVAHEVGLGGIGDAPSMKLRSRDFGDLICPQHSQRRIFPQ